MRDLLRVPAANSAFAIADETLAELRGDGPREDEEEPR